MVSYTGSKAASGVFQTIIGQMPPHSVYVEPFFGSGQIFWKKRPAALSIVMDKRPDLLAKAGAIPGPGVQSICGDALQALPALAPALPAETVIYCDPPYPLGTRKGRVYYQSQFIGHDNELTDEEHSRLLTLLCSLRCYVLISGYDCELYRGHLRKWRCCSYTTRAHTKTVTEHLWCNFDEPEQLHDWRYAGRSFRERNNFHKVARRWLSNLQKMSARKRGYLLDRISERHEWRVAPVPHANGEAIERALAPWLARVPGVERRAA